MSDTPPEPALEDEQEAGAGFHTVDLCPTLEAIIGLPPDEARRALGQ